mmetsp:Transcript_19468/g.20186  ORF Transcript_19468/g.20186 Transcript_19468/m.20186 type:complete len:283 (+) Transcript_19468:43-891(+)
MEGLIKFATRASVLAVGIGITSELCLYDVDGGKRAVIFDKVFGVQENVVSEGTHFRIPFLQEPIIMDIRTKPRTIHSSTGTKDLQMVNLSLRVLSRPQEGKLPYIYSQLGIDFEDRVLPSIGNEVLKAVVAQYNAEELLSKRALISQQIRALLKERAEVFHLILDDVSITHLTFGREFAKAIENKQVAQQEAERAKYIVDKALQEKKSIVIKAQGEAKAAELVGKAIQANPAFIQLRRIEATRDVAQSISNSSNKIYLNADNLLLNHLGEPQNVDKSVTTKK